MSSLSPGMTSTNFSPKSVLGRITACDVTGIWRPSLIRIVTSARFSTNSMLETSPMLTPRTLTSLPAIRPWPAAANEPWIL